MEYEIFRASSGFDSARVFTSGDITKHIHSTVFPEREAKYYKHKEVWGDVLVFLGVGLGYHLSEFVTSIDKSKRIVLVDAVPEFINIALNKFFKGFKSERICTISENGELLGTLGSFISNIDKIQFVRHPASCNALPSFYSRVEDYILKFITNNCVGNSSNKKILLFGGNFFLQRELENCAYKTFGNNASVFNYSRFENRGEYEDSLLRKIEDFKPSLIISVNMKGIDSTGFLLSVAKALGIAVAIWFVDDPHPILSAFSKTDFSSFIAFSWERTYIPYLKSLGFTLVTYLPLASDPDIFFPVDSETKRYKISFTGSPMGGKFLADIQKRFLWTDSFYELTELVSEQLLEDKTEKNLTEFITTRIRETGIQIPFNDIKNISWLHSYIIHTASMKKRVRLIDSIFDLNPVVIGDIDDWYSLLKSRPRIIKPVDYRTELRSIYCSSDINLNTTSCQMVSAVNQRVFDVPLCGSFVISDAQSDITELFAEDKEVVIYQSLDELKEKANYYLKHEKERCEISILARKRILSEHTYFHRLNKIVKDTNS